MSLDLETSTEHNFVFIVNGSILKFTLRTFALITELNCVGIVDNFKFNIEEPSRLIVQYLMVMRLYIDRS